MPNTQRAGWKMLPLVAVFWALPGCTLYDEPELVRTFSTNRPIMYGSPDTDPAHMAVVALTYGPGSGSFCTGTLIANNVVLTAAHCLDGVQMSWIEVFFGNTVGGAGDYRGVSHMEQHSTYNGGNMQGDIALIRLSSNAPSSVTPIPPLPASLGLTSSDVGQPVEFSGFGVTETGSSGQKLSVTANIGYVCNQASSCQGYIAPYAFQYNQQSGGPCSGDSGGPAFILRSSTEYVAGITSYGDPACTQYGVSTMVDPYITWINNYVGVTSEDCGNGVDDDGDGQVDCNDPDCSLDAACQGPDACEAANSVGCGATITGTTVGAPSVFSTYSCLNNSSEDGPEQAYQLTMPASTEVTATMTPTGVGDLDLFLLPPSGASCATGSCIAASLNADSAVESLTFLVPAGGAFLVVETYNTPSTYSLTVTCAAGAEDCDNGTDDDGDGAVDCADPDCVTDPACQTGQELCANGVDDDGDGAVDCNDPDCATAPNCSGQPEICNNGTDDDGDGAIDCADPDCITDVYCQNGQELCTNGLDDDGDGAADCGDPDCATAPSCQTDIPAVRGGCGCRQTDPGNGPLLPALVVLGLLAWIRRLQRD